MCISCLNDDFYFLINFERIERQKRRKNFSLLASTFFVAVRSASEVYILTLSTFVFYANDGWFIVLC